MNELDLFAAAIAIADPIERGALLDRECTGRPEIRQRLDLLLEAHVQSHPMLDHPNRRNPELTGAYESPAKLVGTMIAGRYKLLEEIGDGGMGTVRMAEQKEPVKRLVAVKLIKAGMDSKAVLARFEAERQALALMDHPNIAKVHDAGTDEQGRPYFVMELVKGLPLTEYCDARKLSVNERLDLFVQICSAVQHAHQKAIIHRDLKPSNVLVTEHDGKPVPKVIDFGLAKALNASQMLTDRTLHTAYGTVVGTPLYMAPEQVGINALDVDTRTDIYALGVILYELLTGTTPLEKAKFKEAAWDEVKRLIREEEPPKPSTRLSSDKTLPSLAASRQIEPAQLARLVRGELDWIVMKALDKDRSRRYETATGLAKDVQRYLAGETVEACPPTLGYRLKKMYRRNRVAVLVGLTFAALLMNFGTVSLWLAFKATHAEQEALEQRADAFEARVNAETKAKEAMSAAELAEGERQKAVAFEKEGDEAFKLFREVMNRFTPEFGKPNPTMEEVLAEACRNLDESQKPSAQSKIKPRVRIRARELYGQMFVGLHRYRDGAEQFKLAFEELANEKGSEHLDTLSMKETYAQALVDGRQNEADLKKAEEVLKEVHKVRARPDVQGPGHENTLKTLDMQANAIFFQSEDPFARIVEVQQQALDAALKNPALGENHEITAYIRYRLADMLARSGEKSNRDEARRLIQRSLETYENTPGYGPDHPDTIRVRSRQAVLRGETPDMADLPKNLRKHIDDLVRACKTEDDIRVLIAYSNCALYSTLVGNVDIARECTAKMLELTPRLLGQRHPTMRLAYSLRGWYYVLAREYEKAEVELNQVFSSDFSKLDSEFEGGWDVNAPRNAYMLLAQCLLQRKTLTEEDFQKAEEYLEKAEQLEEKAPRHLGKLKWSRVLHNTQRWEQLVRLYTLWKKPAEAAKWQRKIDEVKRR